MNKKRVERIWCQEGLKIPQRQPKRGRLWLNDGSCILNIVDEFSREALAIRVERRLNSNDLIDVLSDLFILRGVPAHIRSDNDPEFIAKAVQAWITAVGAQTAYITPGGPWENGYIESSTPGYAMSS